MSAGFTPREHCDLTWHGGDPEDRFDQWITERFRDRCARCLESVSECECHGRSDQ